MGDSHTVYTAVRIISRTSVDEWTAAITMWLVALTAAGRPQSTRDLRAHQLNRLAAAMLPRGPWDVAGADLVAWMGGHNWSRNTLRSWRSGIRGFYRWAHGNGYVTVDPSLALPYVQQPPPRPRPTPDGAYREALERADDPRTRLMVRMAAELGLRRGEVARAHVDDLVDDLMGWTLLVHGKGDRARRVPVPDELAGAMRARAEQAAGDGYLFPGKDDGHLSPHYVGKLVSRVMPDAWSMHSLRHRFATLAYSVDRDILTVQDLLGHASPDTTRLYVKVPDASARATVDAVARRRQGGRGREAPAHLPKPGGDSGYDDYDTDASGGMHQQAATP